MHAMLTKFFQLIVNIFFMPKLARLALNLVALLCFLRIISSYWAVEIPPLGPGLDIPSNLSRYLAVLSF